MVGVLNDARAANHPTVDGLKSLRRPEDVAKMRGKTVREILPYSAPLESAPEPEQEAAPAPTAEPEAAAEPEVAAEPEAAETPTAEAEVETAEAVTEVEETAS